MTLDQLQVLQTIVKSGSFRAASQDLHRAQSAVSYAVSTLEDELGFKLFSRDQYRPTLTPQGRAFLKKADDLIAGFSELSETATLLKRGHEPIIRLAVSALWPLPYLVNALKEFTSRYPQTEIKIIQDVLGNDEQLLNEEADLALGHVFNDRSLLVTQELFSVQMIPVCSPKHPLAKLKGKVSDEELMKHPQIIMASTGKNPSRSMGVLNPANVISVQDYQTKKAFLEAGLGWGRLPEHVITSEIKKKELVTAPAKSLKIPVHIARHSQKDLGPCGKFLWSYFSNRQNLRAK
ncbi:LysR family transcriptional regulator [Bdellovibrio sp. HCB2-146]|uniref:LysR family transcriptional regulator n=1 Tax=Bdellovibrio sp. HCB2-146 TaxID=3394362 RepID=UPI0039BCDA42